MADPKPDHPDPHTRRDANGLTEDDAHQPVQPTTTTMAESCPRLIRDPGWSQSEARDTRARLRPFEDDWNAPGMDAYDEP